MALVATLLLGLAGALDPLLAKVFREKHAGSSPTGFPGEWLGADDTTAVGNTTLSGIGGVWSAHWRIDDGWMRAVVPFAYLEPAEPLRSQLAAGTAPPLTVTLTVRDDASAWHSIGVVRKPGAAADVQMLHAWLGQNTGAWRTETVQLPAGLTADGWLYVSEGVMVRELHVEPRGGP